MALAHRVVAKQFVFSDEELDHIINYAINYRIGNALNDNEE